MDKLSGSAKNLAWSRVHPYEPFANAQVGHKPSWQLRRVCRLRFSARMSGVVVSRVSRWRAVSPRRWAIASNSCEVSIPDVRRSFWKMFFISPTNFRIARDP